jgi:D-glycero-D-manno-heptose 1,7-bisphosphate phosphatase
MRRQPVVFLDRDGVINQDSDYYVKSWDEVHILPGALEALRLLREAGCEVYVVTNQAGVGKGLYSHQTLRDMHLRLRLMVRRAGGLIHGIAYCPHEPEAGCACRKPRPGLLRKLAVKYGLDPSQSVMVGDSDKDLEAGHAMGCVTVFVHTRVPDRAAVHLGRCPVKPDHEAGSLLEAVPLILDTLAARAACSRGSKARSCA